MWKAIIELIKSKAYRCEHKWELIDEIHVYWSAEDKMPHTTKHIYRCTKCCDSKIIRS